MDSSGAVGKYIDISDSVSITIADELGTSDDDVVDSGFDAGIGVADPGFDATIGAVDSGFDVVTGVAGFGRTLGAPTSSIHPSGAVRFTRTNTFESIGICKDN